MDLLPQLTLNCYLDVEVVAVLLDLLFAHFKLTFKEYNFLLEFFGHELLAVVVLLEGVAGLFVDAAHVVKSLRFFKAIGLNLLILLKYHVLFLSECMFVAMTFLALLFLELIDSERILVD